MEALPLTEPVLLILLSLAGQPRHGYSILKDVEQMSDGRVVLSTGTLYGALRRLLDDDWIERFEEKESSRGRQAYRLTSQGRRNLQLRSQPDETTHASRKPAGSAQGDLIPCSESTDACCASTQPSTANNSPKR